jgi:hypothetical protein
MLSIGSLSDIVTLVRKRDLSVLEAVDVAMRRARRGKRWRGQFHLRGIEGGKPFRQVACNQLYDQGEQDVLEVFFRNATVPTGFNIGMAKTTYVILETDTMTEIAASELTNARCGGYSIRKAVTRDNTGWPTSALAAGDWQVTSLEVTWTATGAWLDTAGFMFLMSGGTTTPANATGRIMAVAPMSPTRQLQAVNDNVKVTYNLKLL